MYFVNFAGKDSNAQIPTGTLRPIQIYSVDYFSNEDGILAAAELFNPNENYAVKSFDYRFKVFDDGGKVSEIVNGTARTIDTESSRVIYGASLSTPIKSIGRVELEITETGWARKEDYPMRDVSYRDIEFLAKDEPAKLAGVVTNGSAFVIPRLEVVVTFRDNGGFKFFVTGIALNKLRKFSSQDFVISLPFSADFIKKAEGGSFDVELYQVPD